MKRGVPVGMNSGVLKQVREGGFVVEVFSKAEVSERLCGYTTNRLWAELRGRRSTEEVR